MHVHIDVKLMRELAWKGWGASHGGGELNIFVDITPLILTKPPTTRAKDMKMVKDSNDGRLSISRK